MCQTIRTSRGPTNRAFAALDEAGQAALKAEIPELFSRMNRGGERMLIVRSEYLEVVVGKG